MIYLVLSTKHLSNYLLTDHFSLEAEFKIEFEVENKHIFMSVKDINQNDDFIRNSVKFALKYKDYKLVRFTDDDCMALIESYYSQFLVTFSQLPFGVMRSDFCRYLIIFHFGGIYIDSDVKILKNPMYWVPAKINQRIAPQSINAFFSVEAFLPNLYKEYKFSHPYQIVQWSFAANKNHPIFLHCLIDINEAFQANKTKFDDIHNIVELTGPGTMTRAVHQYINPYIHYNQSFLQQAPVHIKDVYIGPPNTMNCGPRTYEGIQYPCNHLAAVEHMYAGSWKNPDMKGPHVAANSYSNFLESALADLN